MHALQPSIIAHAQIKQNFSKEDDWSARINLLCIRWGAPFIKSLEDRISGVIAA